MALLDVVSNNDSRISISIPFILCNCEQIDSAVHGEKDLFLAFPYNSGKKTVCITRYPAMASG